MRIMEYLKDRLTGKAPKGAKRSKDWRRVRKDFLKLNPECASCGGTKKLEVHHIQAFHERPDLEVDPENLITLCTRKKYGINCHLHNGHKGYFRDINPDVIKSASDSFSYLKARHGKTGR